MPKVLIIDCITNVIYETTVGKVLSVIDETEKRHFLIKHRITKWIQTTFDNIPTFIIYDLRLGYSKNVCEDMFKSYLKFIETTEKR